MLRGEEEETLGLTGEAQFLCGRQGECEIRAVLGWGGAGGEFCLCAQIEDHGLGTVA